jgi:hypothetical protein
MRKYLAILTAAFIIGGLASCKPREKCPAYGQKVDRQTSVPA